MTDKMAGRLAAAIDKLTVQIRRYNDLNDSPITTTQKEAELGTASYGDPLKREQSEALHTQFAPQISAQTKSVRRK